MTARSIKRRNANRMTVYMRLTLWRICGGPSERIPGALALVAGGVSQRKAAKAAGVSLSGIVKALRRRKEQLK